MLKSEEKKRQSNIELLRCILMLMVVLLHYNNGQMGGGFLYARGTNLILLKFFESCCAGAVNCFVLISAYFLSSTDKRTLRKPIGLLLTVSGYKLLCYLVTVLSGIGEFSLYGLVGSLIPANWFVILFCVMYVISGYMNGIFKELSEEQLKRFVMISLGIFVLYPTILETMADRFLGTTQVAGLGTVTMFDSSAGYTIVQFMLMYLIGGYLKRYKPVPADKEERRKNSRRYIVVFAVSVLLDFAMSFFTATYTSYSNVFVVSGAVALFMAFLNTDIKYSKVINTIGKSAFGIYILHTCALFVVNFWGLFDIQKYCGEDTCVLVLHLFISVFAMYFVCMVIDMVCRKLFHCLRGVIRM